MNSLSLIRDSAKQVPIEGPNSGQKKAGLQPGSFNNL